MDKTLQQAGLSEIQARIYLFLIKHGDTAPPDLAKALGITRTNAYKVIDRLVVMDLAERLESKGCTVCRAKDPIALSRMLAAEKQRVTQLEDGVQKSVSDLRPLYESRAPGLDVSVIRGSAAVAEALTRPRNTDGPVYVLSVGPLDAENYQTNRQVIPLEASQYTSGVEWSADSDELIITVPGDEPAAVRIQNPAIAQAVRELGVLLSSAPAPSRT